MLQSNKLVNNNNGSPSSTSTSASAVMTSTSNSADDQAELRDQMLSLRFGDKMESTSTSSPTSGSWAGRPARQRPALNIGGGGSVGKGDKRVRRPPPSLFFPSSPNAATSTSSASAASASASTSEQERKLKIMSQTGRLQLASGEKVACSIDDLEMLGDLGNGSCGHVVKMRHAPSGTVMAVKQMRKTGNTDENKRIIMDLDVVLKSHDCEHIVLCLGCFVTDSDVWICMELMSTCFDKLLKQLKQPIPEAICGKVAVSTLKALNYLKVRHDVIHRDVKPSNILLDQSGRVKLCDFGISGRLVDSKARTRSAGCAAYMAPERIDPPHPSKPEYDIRADVWSLGITLVELATGHFPYRDCKTDFEVLTKVLQDDPPLLPRNGGFSVEFSAFVRDCLMKDYNHRPKYKKLLSHPFIQRYEKEEVDVGAWYRSHMKNLEASNNTAMSNGTSPNNNSALVTSSSATTMSTTETFKPQPSPRIGRSSAAWRPAATSTANYPSAISASDRKNSLTTPEEALVTPSSSSRATTTRDLYLTRQPKPQVSKTSSRSPEISSLSRKAEFSDSTDSKSRNFSSTYGSRFGGGGQQPQEEPQNYFSTSLYSSPYRSSASASAYHHHPSYGTSPRSSRKAFDFTYPYSSTSTTDTSPSTSASSLYHQFRSGDARPGQYLHHTHLPPQRPQQQPRSLDSSESQYYHRYYPHHSSAYGGSGTTWVSRTGGNGPQASLDRPARPRTARRNSGDDARSPSQERPTTASTLTAAPTPTSNTRSSYLSNWRSWNWVPSSPLSLRRHRTASTDRQAPSTSSASSQPPATTTNPFDASRRFHPSYRSWNPELHHYSRHD